MILVFLTLGTIIRIFRFSSSWDVLTPEDFYNFYPIHRRQIPNQRSIFLFVVLWDILQVHWCSQCLGLEQGGHISTLVDTKWHLIFTKTPLPYCTTPFLSVHTSMYDIREPLASFREIMVCKVFTIWPVGWQYQILPPCTKVSFTWCDVTKLVKGAPWVVSCKSH